MTYFKRLFSPLFIYGLSFLTLLSNGYKSLSWARISCLFSGVFIAICALPVCAAVNVAFSTPSIHLNETVELIFSSDEPVQNLPDMGDVTAHFRISGQQVQEFSTLVNGQLERTYQMIFNLRPLKTGKIILDRLTLNGHKLDPISLEVIPGQGAVSTESSVTLHAQTDKKQIYEGDSFIYKLFLFDASKIINGQLYPPTAKNADIRQVGQDKEYRSVKNNGTVTVFERTFLITPNKAGTLILEPAGFVGTTRDSLKARKSPDDLYNMGILFDGLANFGAPLSTQSETITLQVLPKPTNWQGWWLPSSEVNLTQSFKIPEQLTIGQPIERTLTLSAKGVEDNKLPELLQTPKTGFKVYPSASKRHTDVSEEGITGYEELTAVLIPTQDGKLTIPSVEVPWFNTNTGQKQIAKVPSKTVYVLEGGMVQNPSQINMGLSESHNDNANILNGQILDGSADNAEKANQNTYIGGATQNHEVKDATLLREMPQYVSNSSVPFTPNKTQDWLLILLGLVIGLATAGLIAFLYIRKISSKKKKPLPDLYPF